MELEPKDRHAIATTVANYIKKDLCGIDPTLSKIAEGDIRELHRQYSNGSGSAGEILTRLQGNDVIENLDDYTW